MGADLSRVRLNALLDFAGIDVKQGGVLLEADLNEGMAIIDRRLRALASDVLGRATVSANTPDAFKVAVGAGGALQIGMGRLYVDGLLAENHGAADPAGRRFDDLMGEPSFTDPVSYDAQPYFPAAPALPAAGRHLVYLDVWNREVTHLEDPDLVEVAVGVETSSRTQTVWQVRVLAEDAGADTTCASEDDDLPGWSAIVAPSTGVLSTGTFEVAAVDDPCELPSTGGYRGPENQLYRVEIHDPGQPGGTATFKWSRENASVGSVVASVVSATELELPGLGRDEVLRFNTDDWVEIIDDVREFSQAAGEIRRITVNEDTRRITFGPALPAAMLPAAFPDSGFPAAVHLRVRRWDHRGRVFRTDISGTPVQIEDLDAPGSAGVIAVPAAGVEVLLEHGITVAFDSTGARGFRAGDYWVFAARTSDASVEILDQAPPRGVHHHYARLGLWDVAAGTVTDCRTPWPPRGEGHDCSCSACVSPESHASGQFTIQDAVNQVAPIGGTVCLGTGQYALREPVRAMGARSMRIRGQGPRTIVVSPGGAFLLQDCLGVSVEDLTVLSLGKQSAVTVRTAAGLSLRRLVMALVGGEDAQAAAVSLEGVVAAAHISENAVLAPFGVLANDPAAVPPPGVEFPPDPSLLAAAVAIEDNLLSCRREAVSLSGRVLHLLSTRIAGNEILSCRESAISTLGLGMAGSSMTISHNSAHVTGNGIRCGVDGALIEGNKLVNLRAGEAVRIPTGVGVMLTTGADPDGTDQCQVLGNQISGFGVAGIQLGALIRVLLVKMNIIERCGSGVVSTAGAGTFTASIENNHVRDIGPTVESGGSPVVGIGVTRAETATVAGNTVRGVGVQAPRSVLRAGIFCFAVLRPRVHGNEVVEVGPPTEFLGESAGIMLRAPWREFAVGHNMVQRDLRDVAEPGRGEWQALSAEGADPRRPFWRVGELATIRLDELRVLVVNGAWAHIVTMGGAEEHAAPSISGSVIGNILQGRGAAPAVIVTTPGDCVFNDNRVEARLNRSTTAVLLQSNAAIVNANRVRGGETSIELPATRAAAVLGNITSGAIIVPGGLQPPWDALNLQAP